jgi:hypothetical protein
MMKKGRADHTVLYFKGNIIVLGGSSFVDNETNNSKYVNRLESLNSCEIYSIEQDKWGELPPFQHARQ